MSEIALTRETVLQSLQDFVDPELGRDVARLGQVHRLEVSEGKIDVVLGLTSFSAPLWQETSARLSQRLRDGFPQADVRVEVALHDRKPEKLGEVGLSAKCVVAVGAGKGGVGKSTIAALLAYGLSRAGCRVGLLDADVYGPSIPHMLGSNETPLVVDQRIQPILIDGMAVMSMGFLVSPGDAVVWRGPMLHQVLTQFLRDTAWGDLDYLLIDMPPGTGDVALSLSQILPLSGAAVVCTPQEVALLDAVKAIAMFGKVGIDVFGMVENMSHFICTQCQSRHDIFGSGGVRRKAEELGVPFLGEVPLNIQMRIRSDEGRLGGALDDPLTAPYLQALARNLVASIVARRAANPPMPTLSVLR